MNPIKFNDEMVYLIFSGNKMQTRRPVKGLEGYSHVSADRVNDTEYVWRLVSEDGSFAFIHFPYKVGDRISVDGPANGLSIIEVTDIRVERVQEIKEMDAIREGITKYSHEEVTLGIPSDIDGNFRDEDVRIFLNGSAIYAFRSLWDSLYAKKGFGWDANPWVWVIEFRRVKP
jgi:hypothetical protein